MKNKADVVIIGGGIIGTATAYYLAKSGIKDIVVLEKSYISSGATGRCGAGVRQQWGLEMNCALAKGSVDIFENLSKELNFDIEYRQGGYLVLAHNETQVEQFKRNLAVQSKFNIPSRLISIEEALEICPYLNTDTFVAATFCQTDGHANPFRTNFAYAYAAEKLGVEINKFTEATDIIVENGRITGVMTDKGRIDTPIVVNAAGGYSKDVAALAGIDIPTYSERHQILVSEPIERLFDTMVISFQIGIYTQQVPHGSIVMGISEKEEPSYNINSSWQFTEYMVKQAINILPIFKDLRIVRQWAGLYNKTPDAQPIVGEVDELPGFFQAVGFSGHGFMIGPKTSKILAQLIAGMEPDMDISPLSMKRFEKGELILEPSVVG
ncbi:FAD-binding oxidoreductase [bacterium]|nr:FAD-binding oxidoreductase [bacterium]